MDVNRVHGQRAEDLKRASFGTVILKASWKKKQSIEGQDTVKTFMLTCTYFCIQTTLIRLDNFTRMFISIPLINQEPHNESKVV